MVAAQSGLEKTPPKPRASMRESTSSSTIGEHVLRELLSRNKGSGNFDVRVILVPDASKSTIVTLEESRWAWLSGITQRASVTAKYYEYMYSHKSKDGSVWQDLSDSGDNLLTHLLALDSQTQSDPFATVIVSYGLGGIPTKKALTRLSERYYDPAARSLLEKLSQVVIISSPHPTINQRERWPLLDNVLRFERKMNSKSVKLASEEAAIVANLCSKFREAGVHCPVLTTFDTQPVTLRHSTNILRTEKQVLVGRIFAETAVRNERMVQLDLENHDLRSLSKTSHHADEFTSYLISAFKDASERQRSRLTQKPVGWSSFQGNIFESTASERSHVEVIMRSSDPTGATFASTNRSTSLGSLPPARAYTEGRQNPNLPCHILGRHPRNPNFFGRGDVMKQIDTYLLPKHSSGNDEISSLRSFALCGLGGMGKTQIALEYAFSRKSSFDAIFWVQADERTSIAQSFGTIATSLGIASDSEVSDLAVSFSIVMQWLVDPVKQIMRPATSEPVTAEASWLIIFDNADKMGLVSEFWPAIGSGAVLITTRDPAGKDFCLGCGIILRPLAFPEAIDLFMALLNKDSETRYERDASTDSLLERFNGLPLALVQVASLIRRRSMTVSEFFQVYEHGVQETGLEEHQASQYDGHYHHSLFTVWAFESLDASSQSLLNVMSLLDPFNIQEAILLAKFSLSTTNHYPDTTDAYVTARSNLLKASLVTRNLHSEHVELHPLVQEVVRARMTEPEVLLHFKTAVTLVHASWPSEGVKWGHETSHREQSGQLIPHALKLKEIFEKREIKLDSEIKESWIELLKDSGWYLYERGEHESALPIFQLALQIARGISSDKPAIMADVLMCLAALGLHTSTPLEVLHFSEEHLKIRQQVCDQFEGEPPMQAQHDLAMGYATMAMAYIRNDEFEKALEPGEIALRMYRSFPMYKNWRIVPYFAVAHMGWALWSLGRNQDAEKLLLEAVDADRIRNAGPSYGLGGLLLPLGNVQTALEKYDEATTSHQAAAEMFYAANGNNYKTAQARLKHATHLAREGHPNDAWQNFQLAINALSRNKYYKPELARARIQAARFRWSIGDVDDAEQLLDQAQLNLAEASIAGNARKLGENELSKMVRVWSR